MSQKIVDVNKQIIIKAKQADNTKSPTMKKPFDEVTKPIKIPKGSSRLRMVKVINYYRKKRRRR